MRGYARITGAVIYCQLAQIVTAEQTINDVAAGIIKAVGTEWDEISMYRQRWGTCSNFQGLWKRIHLRIEKESVDIAQLHWAAELCPTHAVLAANAPTGYCKLTL